MATQHLHLLAGTILEATKTVTGFAPEVLLMTSVYDAMFDEDLPGFLCIKTQFWDRAQTDVDVYIRRRSIDGDWIWLRSRAVSYINDAEIAAIILRVDCSRCRICENCEPDHSNNIYFGAGCRGSVANRSYAR